jgi:redox-sensitive bicupin YhaK (pirin superfamily)
MSNLESDPEELVCPPESPRGIELLEPRDVPLGGPRAMGVRRTLPQKARSLIGAWCFVDHYGPERISMDVPPHPHTGLQTVSWLFSGEIEHRDGVGSHAVIVPGGLNLMTAGRGIAHSEVSLRATTSPEATASPEPATTFPEALEGHAPEQLPLLHGAQLWVALPDASRHTEPFFERYTPDPVRVGDATLRVFIGSLADSTSTARVFSELLGAQIDLPAGASVTLDVDARFEFGVLLDSGTVAVDGVDVPLSHLAYVPPGSSELTLAAGATDARLLLIGGVPLGEQIVMWWNFIGRTHDDIVEYREDWAAGRRFAPVTGYDGVALPAPQLPPIRLKPRG